MRIMSLRARHFLIIAAIFLAVWPFAGCGGRGTDRVASDSDYPMAPEAIRNTEVEMLDGSSFKLADQKGKVILINLWATWCGPCRSEMPELVKLQEKYRDKGFEVIGLDIDPEPKDMIEPFAKEMGLNYQLGWAEPELVEEFFKISERNGIPQSFLINRKGELNGVFFGGGPSVIGKMKEVVTDVVEAK